MATKAEMIERTGKLTSIALNALVAAQQAQQTLNQAHEEGWAEDDPRWGDKFKKADEALKEAQDRL